MMCDLCILMCLAAVCSLIYSILWHEYTTIYLSIQLLMDAWIVSSLELSSAAMNTLVDIFGLYVHVFLHMCCWRQCVPSGRSVTGTRVQRGTVCFSLFALVSMPDEVMQLHTEMGMQTFLLFEVAAVTPFEL